MNHELRSILDQVARRLRRRGLLSALACCWLAWGLAGLALFATGPYPTATVAMLAGLAVASGLGCAWATTRGGRDPRRVAGLVESAYPDLDAGLLTAVEADAAEGPRDFLRQSVIDAALEHGRRHDWAGAVVSPARLAGLRLGHGAAAVLALVAFGLLGRESRDAAAPTPARGTDGVATGADLVVVPGDTEIERGTPLLVVARFGRGVPPAASLVVEGAAPRPMARSLEDPAFAGRVESVDSDLTYHVAFGEGRSPSYRVRVFDHPELTRIDARLEFPEYTGQEPKLVEDVRHVSAVEGTKVDLTLRLSKEVASATLVDEEGAETPLEPVAGEPTPTVRTATTLADSHRYKVRLVDRDGRPNKLAADLTINVIRNKPPAIVMAAPGKDTRVSPLEELRLGARVEDDFGIVRQGVTFTHAGAEPREVVVNGPDAVGKAIKKLEYEHMLDLESLKAAPDELVSYFAWAEDVGPDGAVRRAEGDMYFAEVRHFEEIFRQGEQSSSASQEPQEQGGQAQQAEQLAELQKQVVNGTWRVIRRETGAKPTDAFAEDVKLLRESQQTALDQAGAVSQQLQDEGSKKHLAAAVKAMGEAAERLAAAVDASDPAALKPALAPEQAAYQALLKLRAREFQVSRSRSRSGQQSGSPSQQQLDQLELSEDENRFEEQRQARPEETSEQAKQQREARQVANRLRELARRQEDLGARLKELQSALEAAKDEEARREAERQLKRLREEQRQILRDADELRERMEQEPNRERMADARQQVEQGRENLRRASEALDQDRIPEALTEGARAGEKLDQVREDLRKESAGRFSEDLAQMREQARKLDEDQEKLTERLEADKAESAHSLRDTGDRKGIEQEFKRQGQDLDQLVDRMKGTVQEAEESEPLLAKSLYDAARKADEQAVADALREAEQLARLGVPEEAAKSSRRAGEGLDQLRQGVERAARGILGDEVAALRRAQDEVDDLANQLDREIAQADPGQAGREGEPRQGRPGGQAKGEPRENEEAGQGNGRREPGAEPQEKQEPRPGEGGRGERPDGDRQPGAGPQPGQEPQRGGQPGGEEGQGQAQDQEPQPGGEAQPGQGGEPREGGQPGQGQPGGRQGRGGQGGRNPSAGDRLMDGLAQQPGGPAGAGGPIRGEGFREWSDRMRDVEEILDDPELRAEAARIRDRVRGAREEFRRHAKEPDWAELKVGAADPIRELRDRIAEEVRRREEPDSLVPIDRDPVPPRFAEGVRRYYERLGGGR